MAYDSIFVIGEPMYFKRLGFRSTSYYYMVNTENIPDGQTMARDIRLDFLGKI